ncbi:MAG TPA: hypothetical protein VKE22_17965 [Haliangiales bacterium]|nr:hypothetical protein [Haliangiales bacterium]
MLDPWIIEEIKRREEERDRREPAVIELPLHGPPDKEKRDESGGDGRKPGTGEEDPPRGVVIIDYSIGS